MEIITSPDEMTRIAEAARKTGERIALVPTMGYLHDGHLALMREGRRRSSLLVASIFVNPTQFGPSEDFGRYPRSFEQDSALLRQNGCDLVFAPDAPDMYYPDRSVEIVENSLSQVMCGASRPGHFSGVCTVVAKLFNLFRPDIAIFGAKDFQQL